MVFIFNFSSSHNEMKPTPSVGTRLEGLLLNEMENDFDPRTNNNNAAASPTPPPPLCMCILNRMCADILKSYFYNI